MRTSVNTNFFQSYTSFGVALLTIGVVGKTEPDAYGTFSGSSYLSRHRRQHYGYASPYAGHYAHPQHQVAALQSSGPYAPASTYALGQTFGHIAKPPGNSARVKEFDELNAI